MLWLGFGVFPEKKWVWVEVVVSYSKINCVDVVVGVCNLVKLWLWFLSFFTG